MRIASYADTHDNHDMAAEYYITLLRFSHSDQEE